MSAASQTRSGRLVSNSATTQEASVGKVVQIVGKILGKKLRIVSEKGRKRPETSEVERLVGSFKRAKELCGWQPKVSLEEGLEKTINWIRENRDFYIARGHVL